MNHTTIVQELAANHAVFSSLLNCITKEQITWTPAPDKWSALEIVCHLYDEQREDFRTRLKRTLENPEKPLRPIDPVGWVTERNYADKNFEEMVRNFLEERNRSIDWLSSLISPSWKNIHQHPKLAPTSAELCLANWLAHDYLHIRQITKLKYDYLKTMCGVPLDYAGNW